MLYDGAKPLSDTILTRRGPATFISAPFRRNNSGDISRGMNSDMSSRVYHYCDIIIGAVASQIISLKIVYATVYSDADQRKDQSSASLAFVRGIHRKFFPFDDVIMHYLIINAVSPYVSPVRHMAQLLQCINCHGRSFQDCFTKHNKKINLRSCQSC